MSIVPDNSHSVNDYDTETWREYVAHYITDDNGFWEEELRNEEQSLYENGYISASELYFGRINEDEF